MTPKRTNTSFFINQNNHLSVAVEKLGCAAENMLGRFCLNDFSVLRLTHQQLLKDSKSNVSVVECGESGLSPCVGNSSGSHKLTHGSADSKSLTFHHILDPGCSHRIFN